MKPRSIKITVRLSEIEHHHLKTQTKLTGLSGEALMRSLLKGTDVKPRPTEELSTLLRQLSAIGNNINQIARIANGTGRISKEDFEAIKEMQSRIWYLLKGT